MMTNTREPSLDERRHWEDQLDIQIERYLAEHPEDASTLYITTFRFAKQVGAAGNGQSRVRAGDKSLEEISVRGMTPNMVTIRNETIASGLDL